jgi:putative Mg2+ transporter-C (MgtC) family protein
MQPVSSRHLSIFFPPFSLAPSLALSGNGDSEWRGCEPNTLVALGAATFVLFEGLVPGESSPTRVAAQVVSGIGFLGAGLIFKEA